MSLPLRASGAQSAIARGAVPTPPRQPAPSVDSNEVKWAKAVIARVDVPLDEWAVTAVLEAEGLRDEDARTRFGFPSLFAFARVVLRQTRMRKPHTDPPAYAQDDEPRWKKVVVRTLEGSFFAVPLLAQSLAVLLTGYSLSASLAFSPLEATVVGIATLASFFVTGGVVMAIGRQGTAYRVTRSYWMLRRAAAQLVMVGFGVTALAAVAMGAMEMLSPFVDARAFFVLLSYFVTLSALWIALAVLYVLRLHLVTFLLTAGGAFLVAGLVRGLGLSVYAAQISAILLTAGAGYGIAWRTMARRIPEGEAAGAVFPPADVFAGVLLPFAVYGLGYFGLLFVDRACAWTAAPAYAPGAVWFHAAYELGMDWALVSLFAPMIYLEHIVHAFNETLEEHQYGLALARHAEHAVHVRRFLRRAFAKLAAVSALSVGASYVGGLWLAHHAPSPVVRELLHSPTVTAVFWPGALAYQCLTWGLMVAILLFTLGRPVVVVGKIWQAFGVAAVVGFALSRAFRAEWAAAGFFAGALVFAISMGRSARSLWERGDFLYYAGF